MLDNLVTISVSLLEVELSLSICWLSIAVGFEHNYGKDGFSREWSIGKRFAMEPKEMP